MIDNKRNARSKRAPYLLLMIVSHPLPHCLKLSRKNESDQPFLISTFESAIINPESMMVGHESLQNLLVSHLSSTRIEVHIDR